MRELSDEEVFGSTKELSDADVFGKPAEKKSGIGSLLAQAAYTALRANPTLSVLLPRLEEPKFKSVMEDADPRPFNFAEASKAQRKLDDLQPSKQQFVSQAPQIDDGIIDAASRIGRKSIAAINELPAGVVRALGDAIGSDAIADFAKGSSAASKRFANKTQAPKVQIEGFTPDSIVQRLPEFAEGAAVSTATQLPVMLTGSLPLVYANMFGQSAGNKYNELRDRNIDPRLARSNAAITGAAEVIGERVGGMPGTMAALRGAIAGNPVAEVADKVFKASLRDIPGENLTTGIEYGVDALQGINPDPSLRQYLQAARDTTIQTMLQGGGMTAGITGIAGASNLLRGNRPPAPAEQPPTQPNDVISRVMGQPVPATTAQATTAPPAMDQNAVADRIIAAITGESKQPAVELSDAEVFGETNITTQTEPTETLTPQGNIPSRGTALKDEYSKLQRRLDEDGKSTGDDSLGRALNATYNPLLSNEKDEQLHALNYGEQNNRPDIAAEAKANLATLADKLEQDVLSQSTTPGVPESSPKYQKIKTDLEERKAKKAADAAEIRARLGQPTAQAAQTQASKVRVKNPINGFHGTPEQFDEFSIKNEGELGDGFYFTFDREGAQKWGHRKTWLDFSTGQTIPEEKRRPVNIMQAKLHLQNPASFKDVQAAKKEIGKDWTPAQVTELLKSKGFDGVVSKEDNEIVVFDSGAIELNKKQDVTLTNEGKTAPMRLGVDNVPMADGGKPFKTKLAAQKAKKLQPTMRVIKVDGGFALTDKTPKQLAAEAKAAKRIRGASTGNTGAPMSVHEFIAAEGGLSRSVQSDLGIEGNVKIGNRWLYAGPGKGMTIEQAAEKLKEAGYIEDELHNTAYDIIRRSINDPQYTPEGWEQVAETEREAQFEDYLAAEQEAPADDNWTTLTPEELEETGYNQYNEQAQAEIRALIAQAEALGIDAESIMDDVFYATKNATQQDYENAAKAALQTALQGSNGSSRQDSGQAGTEESRTEESQPEEVNAEPDQASGANEAQPANEDWMAELFGGQAQPAAPQAQSAKPARDKARLASVLADAKREAEAARDDWDNRSYKTNKKQVNFEGDGPTRQESMSISAINEGRKRKTIEALTQEIKAIERMERMLADEKSAERLLDILDKTMEQAEADIANGTAIIGKTPAEAFEYGILQRLDIKPVQGAYSSNKVSKALLAYLQGSPQNEAPGTPTEGLTSYTPQEIEDRLAKLEQAEQERQQQARETEQRAEADAQRDDFTLTGSNRDADVAAARGQRDIFSAPGEDTTQDTQPEAIEPASRALRKQTPGSKIEDFGEKIGGARKDVWTSFKDQLGEISDEDIASQPLSKIWPQPDYQALLDNGADPWTVAFARAARDEIPSKPRQSWKVKRWAEQVRLLRSTTTKLMDGSLSVERAKQLMTQFSSQGMRDLAGRVELYTLVGHGKSLDGVRIRSGEYSMYNRVEYNPPKVIWTVEKEAAATAFSNWPRELATGATREEALKAFKEKYDSLDINPAAKKEVTFDIYSKRGQDGYFIGKKVGRNYIDLAGPFENVKAARDHKATKQAELVAKLEKAKEIPQERRDTNEPRVGEDMRNGQDVTPQMFGETFGFRGVEFGNWVEQGRRQKDLNDAFDALMDMAAVLDIPPKAISLNGELGLAFGARGGGGVNPAAAHYEPGKVVINLTKKSGAGSLGHEWWHALDNYFSRMRAKSGDMMTGALDVSLASRGSPFEARGAVRREMIQAFGQVMKSIKETAIKARSAKLDAKRSKEYWTTDPEMSARAFESYLISKLQDQDASNDYLANIVDPETWKAAEAIGFELEDSYPYPTAGEIPAIRAGFDHFFQTIETRETDKGVAIYSQSGRSVGLPLSLRASELTIEDELEKRLEGLAHRPEVLVLDSAVGTLPGARDEDGISGANWNGRIYLFRDQLSNRLDVQHTLFHELLHYGLRRFLTRDQFISQMSKLYERDTYIKSEADDWVKTRKGKETLAEFGEKYARARGVDEALATLAEPNQGEYLKTDLISRARVTVTRWLAQLADALGFKAYATKIRSKKNEEARLLIQEIFGKLREDAAPARDAWTEAADPAFKNGSNNRDALGRVKFRLGEVALGKLDAATRPLQERFGMRMASPELRRQLRSMKATIDQANRSAASVAQQMKDMPEADRAMVSDIVEKMIAPGVVPPEHAVRVADAITKTMDRQTDELVALGMLSQDSADRWRGRYLPRIYNRKTELGEDTAMDAVKNMFKTGRPTMQGIGGGSLKGRGLFQDVSVDSVDQWLAMGYEVRDPHWKLNQGKLELVDKNAPQAAKDQVTMWRDWTPSERAQMGENRDALFRYVQGYTNMQRDIALGRLFNQIANNPDFVRRSGSEGWVKVPDTEIPDTGGVKRYGNLAGLYVRQDVMSHLSRFEESANEALQLWRDALGLWKEGKTALNPVAHFNNVASNISMAHFAGVSYWDGHKYVGAARDLVNDVPMVEEAREAGLFTGSFTKEELMQNMPPELQKMMQMEDSKLQKAGRQVMNAFTFWLRKPLQNAYEFEDTYFKYLIYRDARQQGMSPEAATDYALKYIFTYDDLPSGARKVRDFAIPFFSWTYKAMPALLHTAMVYPWRFLAPAAMLNGINLVAYALAAGDDDDDWLEKMAKGRELEKEEREALPEKARGTGMLLNPKTIRLGTDSVTGNPVFLDASRVVPGGDMFDMENQAGGLPIPAPLMPNHPVLSAFSAMIANKELFMGREVVDKNDTGLEAAEKRAKWMAGFMLPAVAPGGYHSQRILDATANAMDTVIQTPLGEFTGVDKSGLPVQPKYAAMQTLGIKARPVDLELEASRRKAQESALVNSIAAEVRSMGRLYQRGAVSDDMMERTREKAREKIDRVRDKE